MHNVTYCRYTYAPTVQSAPLLFILRRFYPPFLCRLLDVFPQGLGFVLVFEFMVSDLAEMIRDAANPLTTAQVSRHLTESLGIKNCAAKSTWQRNFALNLYAEYFCR